MTNSQTQAEEYYLEKRIEDCKQVLKQTGETQKEKIKEWAESLERLYELGKSDIPISRISGHIQTTARNDFGWTDGQCDYVTQILDKRFKDSSHAPLSRANTGLETLIIDIKQTSEKLTQLASENPEEFQRLMHSVMALKERGFKKADQFGIPLLGHIERERKISTPKLKPGESYIHHYGVEVYNSLSKFTENWYDLVEKINQYPPTDRKFDKKTGVLLLQLKSRLDKIGWYIQVLSDERYAFSPVGWTGMGDNEEIIGIPKHPDTSKSKVPTLDEEGNQKDESREMTRKNIKKREEKMEIKTEELINSMEGIERLLRRIVLELSEWRDVKSQLVNAIGTRRENVNPKLSEKA